MIYSLKGELERVTEGFVVVNLGGAGLKVNVHGRTLAKLPAPGGEVSFFCHLHVREDALDLYGFPGSAELELFEQLISVSGVGPRSALAILDVAAYPELTAAIEEGRADLLTRASGIGRKTAERIILDLRGKVKAEASAATVAKMESDADILEALVGLGYRREQAKSALGALDREVSGTEARLKAALRILSGKG